MTDTTPDRDSLMALQVLLKIRSDSIAEADEPSCATTSKASRSAGARKEGAALQQRMGKKEARPRTTTNGTTHRQGMPLMRPSVKFNGQTMYKQTPSPRVVPTSDRQALAPNFALNFNVKNNARPKSFPSFPMQMASMEPVVTPSAPVTLQTPVPADKESSRGEEKDDNCCKRPRKKAKNSEGEETPAAKVIRPDEVEAALRSKPQRGRKRDNLSALERLELTRTRNREHAKSTRVRKKARYQELLDNERKYEEFKMREELVEQRQECVQSFLSVRESMVRKCLDQPESLPSTESNGDTAKPSGLVSPHRMVTFSESMNGTPSPVDGVTTEAILSRLDKVVENLADFEFTAIGGTANLSESAHATPRHSALSAMALFDCSLATRVQENLGKSLVDSLSYKLADSTGGVAVNSNGTGFAEVLVTAQSLHGPLVLMTAVLKLQFARDSAKLKSVACFIVKEGLDEHANDECPSTTKESLGYQTSHPSVVSLDPEACGEKVRAAECDPDIGIHI